MRDVEIVAWLWVFVAGIVTGGCSSTNDVDLEADRIAIESMYEESSIARRNAANPKEMADAYVTNLADDALWMVPNAPPVRGKEAVREWAEDFFGKFDLDVDSVNMEPMVLTPGMAIRHWTAVGRYVPVAGGEPRPFDQKFVDVLRRETDGSWKRWQHIWSSNDKQPSIWN